MSSPSPNEPATENSDYVTRPSALENDETLSPQEVSGPMPSQRSKTGSSSSPHDSGGPVLGLRSKEGSYSGPLETSAPLSSQRSGTGSPNAPHKAGGPTLSLRSKDGSYSSPLETSGPTHSQRSRTGSSSSPLEAGGPKLSQRSKDGSYSSPHETSGPTHSQRSKTASSSSPHDASGGILRVPSPPKTPNTQSLGKTGSASYSHSINDTPTTSSKKSKDSSKTVSFKTSDNRLGPTSSSQLPVKTQCQSDTMTDGPFWYDEIPPSLYCHLPDIPRRLLPEFLNSRRTEILCEDLDSEQRRLLRDERIMRVYCNPVSTRVGDSVFVENVELLRSRIQKAVSERMESQKSQQRRLRKTYGIYGAKFRDVKPIKIQNKSLMCNKVQQLAPYSGKHAINVTAYQALAAKPQTITYQLVDEHMMKVKGIEAGEMNKFETDKVRLTPHAIWKVKRFTSPEGCDFRYLKEELQRAKYKALLKTAKIADKDDRLALKSSGLCSNLLPVTSLRPSEDDSVAEPAGVPDAGDSDTVSEEYCYISGEGGFLVKKSRLEVKPAIKKKPPSRAVEPEEITTEHLRRKVAPFLAQQPKGNFIPDPRDDPVYLQHCGAQTKK